MKLDKTTSYFSLDTFADLEYNLAKRHKLFQTDEEASNLAQNDHNTKFMEFVCVVGFHHSVGAQVEYVYPPL